MQNLPIITTTQPVAPAQASAPADNGTVQATETFGSVLARQRASTDEPSAGSRDKNQSTLSVTDSASVAICNELEAPIPDVVNMLPGATLLPATANTNSVVSGKKPALQTPTPDGASTLPGDMLAALLSTPATIQQGASAATQQPIAAGVQNGTRQQPIATGVQGSTRQQPIVVGMLGDTRQQPAVAEVPGDAWQFASTGQSIGEQTATSLFRTQSNATTTAAVTDTTQGKTFSTMLESLGKDAVTTVLPVGITQTSAQAALPDAITLASLTQSTASPIAASQNGPVQVVVNTPMTHDAWGDEFNQKVTWIATQHEQTAELHLNPPHLGPLDVVLNISGDQATALFTSPHAAVRDAVEQALPKLREMLADNGIMLGNAMVNDQSPKEQQAGLADKPRGGNTSLLEKTGDTAPASSTVWPARRHHGMVDTFV